MVEHREMPRNEHETIGGEREKDFKPEDRIFTLQGGRCITCNEDCQGKGEMWTSRLRVLKVIVGYGGDWLEEDCPVSVCMFGEKRDENGYLIKIRGPQDVQRPDLKQDDGVTPRVCTLREACLIMDLLTGDVYNAEGLIGKG